MKTVLAFDFGASSGRAIKASYNDEKIVYEEIHRFENTPIIIDGHTHHNTKMILDEVYKAIDKAGKIDSLAFDTWGVDYALLDENDNLIIEPYHYRDSRTDKALDKAKKIMDFKDLYAYTSNQIMNINTLFQLISDDNLAKAKTLLFMPDYFTYLLCNKKVCEKSIASTSQMLDLKKGTWSKEVLEAFRINPSIFAPIVSSATKVGKYKDIDVIAVAGHDTQSAFAAIDSDENTALLSCGTWSLIGCKLNEPLNNEVSYKNELSNELSADGKIDFLKNISGLWLIQEVKRDLKSKGEDYSFSELEDLAKDTKAFKCFINPDSPLLFTHGNLIERIQNYCLKTNQEVPNTTGEIVRCIYESLVLKYRKSLNEISECTNKSFNKLAIIGGGSKAKLLCQMASDCLGIKVEAGPSEATALGNIILQLIALGEIKDISEGASIIKRSEEIKEYYPKDNNNWDKAYRRFINIKE